MGGDNKTVKITDILTFHCSDGTRNTIFVQVHTDEGLVGVGEPYTIGPDEGILALLESIKPWFVGQDPSRIEWLLRRARNSMRFPQGPVGWSALSGIDHALWDIAGKAAGLPVYMLLGGRFRDRVRVYHGVQGRSPEELAENGLALIEEGYTALKTSPYGPEWRSLLWNEVLREAARRLEALRTAVGEDIDVGVDVHATLMEPVRAEQLTAALAPYRPMFVEEPVRPEHFPSFARLRERLQVPLATGENLYGLAQFVTLIDAQGVDIIQPDLCSCGGILEAKKIAAVAEANYVTVAPHNPLGLLSTAVSVHLAASIPNFVILEYHGDHARTKARFVDDPWKPVDGYMPLPTKPGLGMELDLDTIAESPPIAWDRGFPQYPDGSAGFI
jgi:galactonate dehydratase